MPVPCKFERSLLSHEEYETIRLTHHPAIYDVEVAELEAMRTRLRKMRDKERTLGRQRQRESLSSRFDMSRPSCQVVKTPELLVQPLQRRGEDLLAFRCMLGGSGKACSASLSLSTALSPLLSTERSLLVAHLAQAGSHGLKLSHLDVIDCGMVREADRLIFFVAKKATFQLARD